jgi:hypothetical protein
MLALDEKAYANPVAVQLFGAHVDTQTMSVLNGSVREKLFPMSWHASDDKGIEHPIIVWCWVHTDNEEERLMSTLVFEGFVGPLDALRNMLASKAGMNALMDYAAHARGHDFTNGWTLRMPLSIWLFVGALQLCLGCSWCGTPPEEGATRFTQCDGSGVLPAQRSK